MTVTSLEIICYSIRWRSVSFVERGVAELCGLALVAHLDLWVRLHHLLNPRQRERLVLEIITTLLGSVDRVLPEPDYPNSARWLALWAWGFPPRPLGLSLDSLVHAKQTTRTESASCFELPTLDPGPLWRLTTGPLFVLPGTCTGWGCALWAGELRRASPRMACRTRPERRPSLKQVLGWKGSGFKGMSGDR